MKTKFYLKLQFQLALSTLLVCLTSAYAAENVSVQGFGFWKNEWDNSGILSETDLSGDWIIAGEAFTGACARKAHNEGLSDRFDPNGIGRNGSKTQLSFGQFRIKSPANPTFFFGVKISRILRETIKLRQGPFEVDVNAVPQFATWADEKYKDASFLYNCRVSHANPAYLICLQTLALSSNRSWNNDSLACADAGDSTVMILKSQR